MASVTIELDDATERLIRSIADDEQRSTQEICLEALDQLVQSRKRMNREGRRDPHPALLAMIGLVKQGPTDASVTHDIRPGDEP